MTLPAKDRLPWYVKLAYGSTDFGFAFTDSAIAVVYMIFLTNVIGLALEAVFLITLIRMTWDYINDPIIGFLTDRTRTRWGRRRPYLLFGIIPYGIAFAMLWWHPPVASETWLVVYYTIAWLVYDTILTLVSMPYFALTPELTQDYDERTSLTSFRMAFSIVGGLVAYTVWLMALGERAPENGSHIFTVAAIFGAISAFPMLFTFFAAKERPAYVGQSRPSLRESLRAARTNRPFLFAAGIFLFTWTAISIIEPTLLYFLKYRMQLPDDTADLVAGTVFISALVVLPFWLWVSKKTDKRKSYIAGMLFLSAVICTLIFISPFMGLPVIIALAALAGIGVSAVHVLTWAMIPDAVEVDELASGHRHEGIFYALVTLFRKIAASVAVSLIPLVWKASGYVADAAQQNETAITAIRIMVGPVPSLFLLGGILFAVFYPLSREAHRETRDKIAARAAAD
ncbi:MAG: MFS transporter [Chloroflexi bacterium]|nr:MFS transporter [Chloroflexota bacterium]